MDTRSELREQERTAIQQEEGSPCLPLPLADLLLQAGSAR